MRNTRLYGTATEQIAGNALRSRGCPNPDRAAVYDRRSPDASPAPVRGARTETADTPRAHARRVGRAYAAMLEAQAIVRDARMRGDDAARADAVALARELRAAWLRLSGADIESRELELSAASDACRIRAAA
jgi:hypothetical protein